MPDFYLEMAATARDLLAPTAEGGLGQGEIVLVKLTPGAPPANAWDPPTAPGRTETPLDGAASGVGKELVGLVALNGTSIVASDLQVIVAPWDGEADPEDLLELDGAATTILRVDKIPAVGITAAVRIVVRR